MATATAAMGAATRQIPNADPSAFASHSANARCVPCECLRLSANGACQHPTLSGNSLTVTLQLSHLCQRPDDRPLQMVNLSLQAVRRRWESEVGVAVTPPPQTVSEAPPPPIRAARRSGNSPRRGRRSHESAASRQSAPLPITSVFRTSPNIPLETNGPTSLNRAHVASVVATAGVRGSRGSWRTCLGKPH